jgi:hypothetical protein
VHQSPLSNSPFAGTMSSRRTFGSLSGTKPIPAAIRKRNAYSVTESNVEAVHQPNSQTTSWQSSSRSEPMIQAGYPHQPWRAHGKIASQNVNLAAR